MNNYYKSFLFVLVTMLYSAFYWHIWQHIGNLGFINIEVDYLLLCKIAVFIVPLYVIIIATNWRKLRYIDFSFIYAQITILGVVFVFSGSWTNAIYIVPALVVLICGLYLLSFFDFIRNKLTRKRLFTMWLLILVLSIFINFLLPVLPE